MKRKEGNNQQKAALLQPYRSDIDGLRAVAVLAVVIYHGFAKLLPGGYLGVDIFFVISGFVITRSIWPQLSARTFSYKHFYGNRIRRIFPSLVVVLLCSLIFGYFTLFADEYRSLGWNVVAASLFLSNISLWQEAGYFDTAIATKPLMHLWSLAVEEQFYIFWPMILMGIGHYGRSFSRIVAALTALSFLTMCGAMEYSPLSAFYLLPCRFWELGLGALLSQVSIKRRVLSPLYVFGAIAAFFAPLFLHYAPHLSQSFIMLSCLAGTSVLIVYPDNPFSARILSHPWCVGIGRISYALYLFHWPFLSFARIILSATPGAWTRFTCLVMAVVVSALVTRFVEQPARFGPRKKLQALLPVICLVVAGMWGTASYIHDGYPDRSAISNYVNNTSELVHPLTTDIDNACRLKLPVSQAAPPFDYCLYHDAKATETIVVIGDSHAYTAFPGIGMAMEKAHQNALLLASSACPPFAGTTYGETLHERNACIKKTEMILREVIGDPSLHNVLIMSRGPLYMTGNGFGDAETQHFINYAAIPEWQDMPLNKRFVEGLKATTAKLIAAGKTVFYVLENPEMAVDVRVCLPRPLRKAAATCDVPLATVMARQEDYRNLVMKIPGLHVIDPVPAFCPQGQCSPLHDGVLLYVDYNHLSVSGSVFQAQQAIMPYISKYLHSAAATPEAIHPAP